MWPTCDPQQPDNDITRQASERCEEAKFKQHRPVVTLTDHSDQPVMHTETCSDLVLYRSQKFSRKTPLKPSRKLWKFQNFLPGSSLVGAQGHLTNQRLAADQWHKRRERSPERLQSKRQCPPESNAQSQRLISARNGAPCRPRHSSVLPPTFCRTCWIVRSFCAFLRLVASDLLRT